MSVPRLPAPVTRSLVALACGVVCSPLVWLGSHAVHLAIVPFAAAGGLAYGSAFTYRRGDGLGSAFTAGAMAVPMWLVVEIVALPLLHGRAPAWEAASVQAAFPALVGWMLFAVALGATMQLAAGWTRWSDTKNRAPDAEARPPVRVVVLGGGFAGMTVAMKMEKMLGADRTVSITLVAESNALLFTPMLAEVAGGSIEATHISAPLRSALRRSSVIRARATAVDLTLHTLTLVDPLGAGVARQLEYDHLILALGAVSNFVGRDDIRSNAMDFKTLADAIRIRNRVIAMFESADNEPDGVIRRRLLTFVVAGGGFAGIELAGALNDFARGISGDYPSIDSMEIGVIVVHGGDRILPELSETLATYALAKMKARGVRFELGARVSGATSESVTLNRGLTIPCNTLVWTAGTTPNPLVATLDVMRDRRGAVIVDAHLSVPDRPGLWALGDCAAVPDDEKIGTTYPPTAQHALREGATLARNVVASIRCQPLAAFSFNALGSLCIIGYQTACAEIRAPFTITKLHFSGAFAWFLWRGIYLAKLPGFEQKLRVLVDWTTELFFPRGTVETSDR